MPFCTNCGARLTDTMKFCPECGTAKDIAVRHNTTAITEDHEDEICFVDLKIERERSGGAMAVGAAVQIDGLLVGTVKYGEFIVVPVLPGEHTIYIKLKGSGSSKDFISVPSDATRAEYVFKVTGLDCHPERVSFHSNGIKLAIRRTSPRSQETPAVIFESPRPVVQDPLPPSDSCLFRIYRKAADEGADVPIRIYCDYKELAEIGNGEYYEFRVESGTHKLSFLSDEYLGAHADVFIPEDAEKRSCAIAIGGKKPHIMFLQPSQSDKPAVKSPSASQVQAQLKKEEDPRERDPDEPVIVCRKHWTTYILPTLILFYFVFADFIHAALGTGLKESLTIRVFGGLFTFIWMVLHYKYNYIILTEKHITARKGIIRSQIFSTPLNKVQNVGVSNGLMGKIFGYHTLVVDNAGTGNAEYVFTRCAHAVTFAAEVQKRI